jgi:Bestrophin, RFP-TM, chloride channel
MFVNVPIALNTGQPLALVETSGWYCILWCPFITWGIWGSETAANELSNPFGYDFNDLRLGEFTRNIQVMIRRIYAKSLDRNLSFQTGTPNMLLVPQSEGGTLQDPEPEPKKKK